MRDIGLKSLKTPNRSRESRKIFDFVDDKKQRVLNEAVGNVGLRETAIIHFTRKNRRDQDQIRNKITSIDADPLKHLQEGFPNDQQIEVLNHSAEPAPHLTRLLRLTRIESDGFRIISDMHQPITKISLISKLIRIDCGQSAARENHHTRDDRRVEKESSG